MITRLSIQHYRSLGNVNLDLGPLTILVGQNGTGKSNIVDAIKFVRDALHDGLEQAVSDRQGIQTIRQWSATRPYNLSISLQVRQAHVGVGSFSFTLASRADEYVIRREEGIWEEETQRASSRTGETPGSVMVRQSYVRDHLGQVTTNRIEMRDGLIADAGKQEQRRMEDQDQFYLSTFYSFGISRLRHLLTDFESYSIFPNTLRQPQKQSKEVYLGSHGENLASIVRRMRRKKKSERIAEIVGGLKYLIPNLDNILAQSLGGYITPQFRVTDDATRKSHTFHVNQVSDGALRVLGLLVALYQDPRPYVIAIEEPELTIHPGVLQVIAESIQEVSRWTQILVTTHSPHLLDYFEPNQIKVVEMESGSSTVRSLAKSQVESVKKKLFSLGELMTVEGLRGA